MATYTSNYAWTKPEGSDPVDITVLNNNLDSQDNIVHNAYMQFAPVFSTASTYAVDDVVLYANNLYKCITAVTVAGAWDAAKWTQVKVSDICGGGGGGGTSDYSQLTNKPSINSVTLSGNKTSADLGLQDAIQIDTMPTASAIYVGKIVQFVGTTDATYMHGYYYECTTDGSTYSWTQLNVQPSSGGGGTYAELPDKPSINGNELSGNKTGAQLGLQNTLTFDNVPTDGSNNPVKSDGIYDSEKDIYAVMGKMGAKNLLSYPYKETTKTQNGITFTDNGDGTITANGTATADAYFSCHSRVQGEANDLIIPNGRYILTGCPSGGGTSTYNMLAERTYNGSVDLLGRDSGDGVLVVANGDDFSVNEVNLQINIFIKNRYAITNPITFKPMLRLASDTDDTYQPYAKTNKELTKSYPASQVMMSDGVTSVEDKFGVQTIGTAVDISGYTINNKYTIPTDGYIAIRASSSGANVRVRISGVDIASYNSGSQFQSIYVRKGLEAYVAEHNTGTFTVYFYPLA